MRLLLAITFVFVSLFSFADQLQWLSKEDATRAARYIRKQGKIFLFCGCCGDEHYRKIRPSSTEIRATGEGDFYEVVVTWYPADSGTPQSQVVDLAYVWVKKKRKWFTVGTILKLEHDPCKPPVK